MSKKITDGKLLDYMQTAFSENGGVVAGTTLTEHNFTFTNVKRVVEKALELKEKEVLELIKNWRCVRELDFCGLCCECEDKLEQRITEGERT